LGPFSTTPVGGGSAPATRMAAEQKIRFNPPPFHLGEYWARALSGDDGRGDTRAGGPPTSPPSLFSIEPANAAPQHSPHWVGKSPRREKSVCGWLSAVGISIEEGPVRASGTDHRNKAYRTPTNISAEPTSSGQPSDPEPTPQRRGDAKVWCGRVWSGCVIFGGAGIS